LKQKKSFHRASSAYQSKRDNWTTYLDCKSYENYQLSEPLAKSTEVSATNWIIVLEVGLTNWTCPKGPTATKTTIIGRPSDRMSKVNRGLNDGHYISTPMFVCITPSSARPTTPSRAVSLTPTTLPSSGSISGSPPQSLVLCRNNAR
jgi:hypothetical protein